MHSIKQRHVKASQVLQDALQDEAAKRQVYDAAERTYGKTSAEALAAKGEYQSARLFMEAAMRADQQASDAYIAYLQASRPICERFMRFLRTLLGLKQK